MKHYQIDKSGQSYEVAKSFSQEVAKANLVAFIYEFWNNFGSTRRNFNIILAGGFPYLRPVGILARRESVELLFLFSLELGKTLKEADIPIAVHVASSLRKGSSSVIVRVNETDIPVVLLQHSSTLSATEGYKKEEIFLQFS
ncbi:hypothetical protein QYM36_016938 [Artemia franciscana]|uniref:Uncharacterized protein n=1 Tax=Artemia franciscana TaxID=6661 RepID=A0AA88HCW8_ARTSF|nr:hypothetical protein QYM36_016938 [Artemia franciscana]